MHWKVSTDRNRERLLLPQTVLVQFSGVNQAYLLPLESCRIIHVSHVGVYGRQALLGIPQRETADKDFLAKRAYRNTRKIRIF